MEGFILRTNEGKVIRFAYYSYDADATVSAFNDLLPFQREFVHARLSGQEFWTESAPRLDIIQENASIFTQPGEVVICPSTARRTRTAGSMGIYYGEGKGLDACNIFAKVLDEDMHLLKELGETIWRHGEQTLRFEKLSR
jgi:Protein of unknown function (DUF3830)